MKSLEKTHVTFQSERFNKTEQRESFVNPDCFGDDVCEFMIAELHSLGMVCEGPFSEDWGWCFVIRFSGRKFLLGTNYHGDGFWLIFLEAETGLLANLFGRGRKSVPLELRRTIHKILTATDEIQDVRWFDEKQFNKGEYQSHSTGPD
jgi:hypothetical protein